MIINTYPITKVYNYSDTVFSISVDAPEIARNAHPGQFCQIKVSSSLFPLLRRPFSISDVQGDNVSFLIETVGEGTQILSLKQTGDFLDIIGPLGNGFITPKKLDVAFFVAGGLGIAPFPHLQRVVNPKVEIISIVGGRSKKNIIELGLKNVNYSTDDGTLGFHGNAVELFSTIINHYADKRVQVYSCGPTPLLRAISNFCKERGLPLMISTEGSMACGIGICQGCPIESTNSEGYKLICKDGPVFNSEDVIL